MLTGLIINANQLCGKQLVDLAGCALLIRPTWWLCSSVQSVSSVDQLLPMLALKATGSTLLIRPAFWSLGFACKHAPTVTVVYACNRRVCISKTTTYSVLLRVLVTPCGTWPVATSSPETLGSETLGSDIGVGHWGRTLGSSLVLRYLLPQDIGVKSGLALFVAAVLFPACSIPCYPDTNVPANKQGVTPKRGQVV